MARSNFISKVTNAHVEDIFKQFSFAFNDFHKVLNTADKVDGSGVNFAAAMLGMSITEPLAKMCFPYSEYNGHHLAYKTKKNTNHKQGKNRQDIMDDIDAKIAVTKFWAIFFDNKRYAEFGDFIWSSFRNSNSHLFMPLKIMDVPVADIDNSVLSGVHWPGTLEVLENDPSLRAAAEKEHLTFQKYAHSKGVVRPYFTFIPHIYYYDLKEAADKARRAAWTNKAMTKRLEIGWELFQRSYKKSLISFPNQQAQIISEVTDLISK